MKYVRSAIAVCALGILAWRLVKIRALLRAVSSTTSVTPIPWNDAVQKAIETLLQQAGLWAQATALLLGALVALWVAKGDEPQLALSRRQWPEITTWLVGASMLLAGLYCYNEYIAGIATALEVGGVTSGQTISIPDVFAEKYEALRSEEFRLLVFGALASVSAIFGVRHLAGR